MGPQQGMQQGFGVGFPQGGPQVFYATQGLPPGYAQMMTPNGPCLVYTGPMQFVLPSGEVVTASGVPPGAMLGGPGMPQTYGFQVQNPGPAMTGNAVQSGYYGQGTNP
jgi:hypothetical protein